MWSVDETVIASAEAAHHQCIRHDVGGHAPLCVGGGILGPHENPCTNTVPQWASQQYMRSVTEAIPSFWRL